MFDVENQIKSNQPEIFSFILFSGLAKFFDNGVYLRKDAIWASIHRVRQILHWFNSQHQLAFYASSLLFVYEGQPSSSSLPSVLRNPSVDDTMMKTAKLLLMSDGGQGQEEEANQEGARAENEGAEHNNNTEEATNYTNQRKLGYHLCGRDYHLNNSVDYVAAQIKTTSDSGGVASAPCEEDNSSQQTVDQKQSPNRNGDKAVLKGNDTEGGRKRSSRSIRTEEEGLKGGGGPENTEDLEVEVRMIDFAHVFPSDSHDHGYIYGLKHLLTVLEQILCDAAQSSRSSTS